MRVSFKDCIFLISSNVIVSYRLELDPNGVRATLSNSFQFIEQFIILIFYFNSETVIDNGNSYTF